MRTSSAAGLAALAVLATVVGGWGLPSFGGGVKPAAGAYKPPPDSAIPTGPFGDMVRFGEQIFREPGVYATQYVGNDLRCSNCHLSAGRLANAAPMGPAFTAYPAYRSKNGHVNSFQERLQGCFTYSMNGQAPPLGDPILVALESYAYFLAAGLPVGGPAPGRNFPALRQPLPSANEHHGKEVYAQHCASCHGPDGLGQSSGGQIVFPPLWGPRSFNKGAGMASVETAAEFIQANMPLGLGGSLTEQDALDVATYVDCQARPPNPSPTDDIREARTGPGDSPATASGRTVDHAVLGAPPSTTPACMAPSAAEAR